MADKGFPAHSKTRLRFAIALATMAGMSDAIGFIEYSQLFMSFMSGNTTRFGEAVSSANWVGVIRFGGVIVVFCLGAFVGTLIAAWSGRWRLPALLGTQSVLMVVGVALPHGPEALPWHVYPIVLALGLQNATLQDEAGRSLALTYVTGSVVRFGAGLANMLLHKPAPSFRIQAPLWAGLTAGAVIGSVLQHLIGESAFLIVAGVIGALAVTAFALAQLRPGSEHVISVHAPQPDAHPEAKPTVIL